MKNKWMLGLILGLGLVGALSAAPRVVLCEDLYQEG